MRSRFLCAALSAYLWCADSSAAQSIELRGRVVSSAKEGVSGVEVTVLDDDGVGIGTAHSRNDGRFSILSSGSQKSLQLTFKKLSYVTVSRSVPRPDNRALLEIGEIVLLQRLDVLEPVTIKSAVLVPTRGEKRPVGSKELDIKGMSDFISDPSSLNSLLDGLREVNETSEGGRSILGASPMQNRTLVDGVDFGASNLPRDAIQTAKVLSNPYDPSKGRFAGAALQVSTRPASAKLDGTLRFQNSPTVFSQSDRPTHEAPANRWTGSGFFSGPFGNSGLRFLVAIDAARQSTKVQSLASDNAAQRRALGIDEDSIVALKRALSSQGAPIGPANMSSVASRGSAISRLDFQRSSSTSFFVSMINNWENFSNGTISKLSTPTTGSNLYSQSTRLHVSASSYLGKFLYESNFAASISRFSNEPTIDLPHGRVRIGTVVDGRSSGLSSVEFGGSLDGRAEVTDRLLVANNSLAWIEKDGRHNVKIAVEAIRAHQRIVRGTNEFGAFEFLNLDDVLGNTPLSYRREYVGAKTSFADWNVSASLGDIWRALPGKLEIQGGVRFDASVYPSVPLYNAKLDSLLRVRTNEIPNAFDISPRIGFTWRPFGVSRTALVPGGMTTLEARGVAATRSPLDAGGIPIQPDADFISISGGFGKFRGTTPLPQLSSLVDQTGTTVSRSQLSCSGYSAPRPNWRNPATFDKSDCAEGDAAMIYEEADIVALSPTFRPPVSYRGSLGIEGITISRLILAPQILFTFGKRSEGLIDRNFRSVPSFALGQEDDRPIFALASAIDSRSGQIASGASRKEPSLGAVRVRVSDLNYRNTQFSFAIAPKNPLWGQSRLFAIYGYAPHAIQTREYPSIDAPRVWQQGPYPRHRVDIGLTALGPRWLRLAIRTTLQSGRPFTPMVAQDINGDGLANDRAFVPSQSSTDTAALTLDNFVAKSESGVRSCLSKQAGTIAAPASCRTGWRMKFDVALNGVTPTSLGLGSRVRFSLNLFNVSSALVQLFKLDDTPFARDARSQIDQRLFFVSGFDSTTRSFNYALNSNFGRPRLLAGASGLAPFELRLGAQILFGASMPQTSRIGALRAGSSLIASSKVARDSLVRLFLGPDALGRLLQLSDSLTLDANQIQGMTSVHRAYISERDLLLRPVYSLFESSSKGAPVEDRMKALMGELSSALSDLERRSLARALSYLNVDQRRRYDSIIQR